MPNFSKVGILVSLGAAFAIVLSVGMMASIMPTASDTSTHACKTELKKCSEGIYVSRVLPSCEFAVCPVNPTDSGDAVGSSSGTVSPIPPVVACTMEAKQCPNGTYVGRTGPACEFAKCPISVAPPPPVPSPAPGSCTSDNDCPTGYSCEDISPVVREGSQNLRCWKQGAPRPICLSGYTHIATPSGDVLVKDLREGDHVWSVDSAGKKVAVAVLISAKTRVPSDHQVMHLVEKDGRELFVSPGHKVADGRTAGSLKAGDTLDGSLLSSALLVPYDQDYTYDILPAGDTGMYFGNGILLQSTLKN